MELQNYIDDNLNNYITNFKNFGLVVKTFSKENLILIKYKYNDDLSEDWMKYCRGCIIDTNTNKLIFIPPIKANEIEYPLTNTEDMNFFSDLFSKSDFEITPLIDGTMINLFYHNDKWLMSSRSDIGCLNKWDNKFNFKKMFIESIKNENFYDYLNKHLTYSFVLINKNNRNISNIVDNFIVLIETYDTNTMCKIEIDNQIFKENKYIKIYTLENIKHTFKNITDIDKFYLLNDFNFKGLNIINNNIRYKMLNPIFIYVQNICINSTNLFEKYIYLKKNNKIKLYLNYYPEFNNEFQNFSNKYDIMINELYDNYIKMRITKEIKLNDVPYQLKPLIYNIHKIYLDTKKKINKITIETYIKSLDSYKILFILKYY